MIFVYPTDTVWGIGASIENESACMKVHEVKGSDPGKPMSILFSDLSQLKEWFDVGKAGLSDNWLLKFFSMETTLSLPHQYAKKEISKVVTADSPFVAFRCLENELFKTLVENAGAPVTTTSLNETGENPITNTEDARNFVNERRLDCEFMEGDVSPSGHSSTILCLPGDGKVIWWRKGERFEEVKRHVELLST